MIKKIRQKSWRNLPDKKAPLVRQSLKGRIILFHWYF